MQSTSIDFNNSFKMKFHHLKNKIVHVFVVGRKLVVAQFQTKDKSESLNKRMIHKVKVLKQGRACHEN